MSGKQHRGWSLLVKNEKERSCHELGVIDRGLLINCNDIKYSTERQALHSKYEPSAHAGLETSVVREGWAEDTYSMSPSYTDTFVQSQQN